MIVITTRISIRVRHNDPAVSRMLQAVDRARQRHVNALLHARPLTIEPDLRGRVRNVAKAEQLALSYVADECRVQIAIVVLGDRPFPLSGLDLIFVNGEAVVLSARRNINYGTVGTERNRVRLQASERSLLDFLPWVGRALAHVPCRRVVVQIGGYHRTRGAVVIQNPLARVARRFIGEQGLAAGHGVESIQVPALYRSLEGIEHDLVGPRNRAQERQTPGPFKAATERPNILAVAIERHDAGYSRRVAGTLLEVADDGNHPLVALPYQPDHVRAVKTGDQINLGLVEIQDTDIMASVRRDNHRQEFPGRRKDGAAILRFLKECLDRQRRGVAPADEPAGKAERNARHCAGDVSNQISLHEMGWLAGGSVNRILWSLPTESQIV